MTKKKLPNIIWGVSGSISIYKSLDIISELTKGGYNVFVVMTKAAREFINPITFRSISRNKVYIDLFSDSMDHIYLSDIADLIVIAPASYDFISKIANGIADDLLTSLVSVNNSPCLIAPAMNDNMYLNPILQRNIDFLKRYGYDFISPDSGDLACGHKGLGRFPVNEKIKLEIFKYFGDNFSDSIDMVFGLEQEKFSYLKNKKILITAGGTREAIDAVRYIGNYSSGKMGNALAKAAYGLDANVRVIYANIDVLPFRKVTNFFALTSWEMLELVQENIAWADIFIMAAAVSDYLPKFYSFAKFKKQNKISFEMIRNIDILQKISMKKRVDQVFVGFAAENGFLIENARKKLEIKNLDMIILNDISAQQSVFGSDYNQVNFIFSNSECRKIDRMDKYSLSFKIFEEIGNCFFT